MSDCAHVFDKGSDDCRKCGADIFLVATGAYAGDEEPRAQAAAEIRDRFMDTCRAQVDYWAGPQAQRETLHERLSGLMHSVLCMIDGVTLGLPAFTLAADPHPDDKKYDQDNGGHWIEPGTVINGDGYLHEILYNRGTWEREGAEGSRP